MDGLNIVGLGSIVTGDASGSREPSNPVVTLSEGERVKRIKAEKRTARRAAAKGKEKLAAEDSQYMAMVHDVAEAIRSNERAMGKWEAMGPVVVAFYGNGQAGADAFESVRAAFTVDAIVAGLSDAERALWHTDLPRKGTKDAAGYPDLEAKRAARNDLVRKVSKYWKRIFDYAYPKEKVEAVETGETGETGETSTAGESLTAAKLAERVGTLLKQLQGAGELDGVDVTQAVRGLNMTLAALN